jgi:hypothetical protein
MTPPRHATLPASVAAVALALVAVAPLASLRAYPDDLDRPPINYSTAPVDNAVTRFQHQLATGKARLAFEDDRGYLKSVLAGLNVPESSQVLVFSKTSLQRSRIAPKTPRAIYFNDDVYVGFCLRGDVIEVSVADHSLGTVFYTLDQEPTERPRFDRQTEHCLICHGSSATRGVPGHLVRSIHPDRQGDPMVGSGSYRTDDASPFGQRYGGWYVTGKHGSMKHMGNRVFRSPRDYDDPATTGDGQNVTDLRPFFSTGPYLTPHSDIVALMVLTHQVAVHNRIARATLETRSALHYEAELNKSLNEPPGKRWDSAQGRIRSAGDDLLKALLFCGEEELTDRVEGTTDFAREFAARGPFDAQKRSLREFDLTKRLFKHPCSFLIYSEAFDKMPAEVKDYVLRRLFEVLTGQDTDKAFAHLSADDRAAILDILRQTKKDLPTYWRE